MIKGSQSSVNYVKQISRAYSAAAAAADDDDDADE